MGVECSGKITKFLADRLYCKVRRLRFKYLGFQISANPRSIAMWDSVVEKFERKLSSWKRQHLSLGCTLTLIKSTLANLPVYYISLFKMPIAMINKLDRIRRNFFWD